MPHGQRSHWLLALISCWMLHAPASWAGEAEEVLHLLQTAATAQEDVVPDSARLSLSVITQAATVQGASTENATRMGRLLKALKVQAWPELTLQTGGFSVTPVYQERQTGMPYEPAIVAYRVTHQLTATLERLDAGTLATRITQLFDDGLRQGANDVEGPTFFIKDPAPIRERLLATAVRDAAHRARLMAEAAGVQLTRLHRLQDTPSDVIMPVMYASRMRAMSEADAAPPIEVGTQTMSVTVTASYEVAPAP